MKNRFLIPEEKLNRWYAITAGGFLLYLIVCGIVGQKAAGVVALPFTVIAIDLFCSVCNVRKEKESYNLLWGSTALMLLLGACSYLSLRLWLGLL